LEGEKRLSNQEDLSSICIAQFFDGILKKAAMAGRFKNRLPDEVPLAASGCYLAHETLIVF